MEIDQQTMAELLQLGGQYALPAAALLRAIYSGWRGKFPEGIMQILAASFFAGLTAIADNQTPDLRIVVAELAGNTIFTAGLLAFIMAYLLKLEFRSIMFDGVVGAFLGAAFWFVWTYILGNPWGWPMLLLTVPAGAAIFVALRFAMRQIIRLVRIATYFIIIAIFFIVAAGGLWAYQTFLVAPAA